MWAYRFYLARSLYCATKAVTPSTVVECYSGTTNFGCFCLRIFPWISPKVSILKNRWANELLDTKDQYLTLWTIQARQQIYYFFFVFHFSFGQDIVVGAVCVVFVGLFIFCIHRWVISPGQQPRIVDAIGVPDTPPYNRENTTGQPEAKPNSLSKTTEYHKCSRKCNVVHIWHRHSRATSTHQHTKSFAIFICHAVSIKLDHTIEHYIGVHVY